MKRRAKAVSENEVEAVARAIYRSYSPCSWPLAWKGANDTTRNGWRRTARVIIRTLDKARASKRISELEAIAEKCLDPEYMKNLTESEIVVSMAKRIKAAEVALTAAQERERVKDAALKRISEHSCGCRPVCVCFSESGLKIWREEVVSIATAALTPKGE